MGDAAFGDLPGERGGDVTLADDFVEGLGAVLPVERLVFHAASTVPPDGDELHRASPDRPPQPKVGGKARPSRISPPAEGWGKARPSRISPPAEGWGKARPSRISPPAEGWGKARPSRISPPAEGWGKVPQPERSAGWGRGKG